VKLRLYKNKISDQATIVLQEKNGLKKLSYIGYYLEVVLKRKYQKRLEGNKITHHHISIGILKKLERFFI